LNKQKEALEAEYKEKKRELKEKELAKEEEWKKREKEEQEDRERQKKQRQEEREKKKLVEKEKQVIEMDKKSIEKTNSDKLKLEQLAKEWAFTDPDFPLSDTDTFLLKKVFIMLAKQWNLALGLVPSNPKNKPKEWLPDDRLAQCTLCCSKFTFFKRRHHCRLCGELYCGACSDRKQTIHRFKFYEVRVCNVCYIIIQAIDTPSNLSTTSPSKTSLDTSGNKDQKDQKDESRGSITKSAPSTPTRAASTDEMPIQHSSSLQTPSSSDLAQAASSPPNYQQFTPTESPRHSLPLSSPTK